MRASSPERGAGLIIFGVLAPRCFERALIATGITQRRQCANLGYNLMANTQARFTLRNAVSAVGLPSAHDFYGISADGKQGDQDIYSGLTVENRFEGNWHNLLRYDIARKREQEHALHQCRYAHKL